MRKGDSCKRTLENDAKDDNGKCDATVKVKMGMSVGR